MKTFFCAEHSALEAVGALSINVSINHTQLKNSLDTLQKDLTSHLEDSLHANLIQALQTYSHLEREHQAAQEEETKPPPAISANAAVTPKTDPALLTLIQSLKKEIDDLKARSVIASTTLQSDDLPSINPRTQQPY